MFGHSPGGVGSGSHGLSHLARQGHRAVSGTGGSSPTPYGRSSPSTTHRTKDPGRSSARSSGSGAVRSGTLSRTASGRAAEGARTSARVASSGAGASARASDGSRARSGESGSSNLAARARRVQASSSTRASGTSRSGAASDAEEGSSKGGVSSRERLTFSLSDLELKTTVGTGTFGRVRVVRHRPSGRHFALKILRKSEVVRMRQVEHLKSEVEILTKVSHPFIVNLFGHIQDSRRLYMLLEFVPGGEVFTKLRDEDTFSLDATRFYAAEITLAFQYLHAKGIVYRDLKPENLLFSASGHMKITDFGFAKRVGSDKTFTLCGTPDYLAPEIIQVSDDLVVGWMFRSTFVCARAEQGARYPCGLVGSRHPHI
jgi:serine/threonine protein kinase